MRVVVVLLVHLVFVGCAPRFDPTAIMRNVLVPADAANNSVVYRIRASDPDFAYPLIFATVGDATTVSVDTLNCTRFNSVCQANVVLKRKLEPGRVYDFRVSVTNNKRQSVSMECSIRATNASTPLGGIFPGAPTILHVSENARRNTELGALIARGNPLREKAVLLELWGSPQFSLRQRLVSDKDAEGTIILLGKLDYEVKTVHYLTIFANDPYGEPENDSRNIATWPILVTVQDEQDTPPTFTLAPPTTDLDPKLKPGDVILRVRAEDGDRGNPRDIRYGLVSEGNPFMPFFNLSEETGELRLAKPLSEIQAIAHSNTPIVLTVVAEELRSNPSEPAAQSSTVKLALIPPAPASTNPHFSSPEYTIDLEENTPPGTVLKIPNLELIAQAGLFFKLELENSNGTFDISPGVVEGRSKFMLKVGNNEMLDYERNRWLWCRLTAKEFGGENLTSEAYLRVNLINLNDNAPVFHETNPQIDVLENREVGTSIYTVIASDPDGDDGVIRKRIYGSESAFFEIDEASGVIKVKDAKGLDSERASVIQLNIEISDTENTATTTLTINVIDVNDEIPKFEKNPYEFILDPSLKKFTLPAFITATDADITPPNNEVRYELIDRLPNLTLHEVTGELLINPVLNQLEMVAVKARAYDGGVPRLWTECEVRLYPPEGYKQTRKMVFVVSGNDPNMEAYLGSIVGGRVAVDNVRPYLGPEPGAFDISKGNDRRVVETTVTYSGNSVVDIERLQTILNQKKNDNHVEVKSEEIVKSAGFSDLWWLLLVLLLLILLLILILILCCVCEGCPLYVPPKKRRKVTPDVEKLVIVKNEGAGVDNKESKSVQVVEEWFGRREAWTPEQNADSIRRHEMDRGSERGSEHKTRDHQYIREGNADILRLMTRAEHQRPVTLIPENAFFVDSGKDILMRRFMDQQSNLNRITSEHDLLEESLRQQNLLLRQLLLERERDLRLETQSLPAGTQTDQNVSTQTEPLFLRPPRRQTRSDNDASDDDDDDEEEQYVLVRKRRNVRKVTKRKIRTPIQEESESEYVENREKSKSKSASVRSMKVATESERKVKTAIKKEILQEISDSLNQSDSDRELEEERVPPERPAEGYTSDSLEEDVKQKAAKKLVNTSTSTSTSVETEKSKSDKSKTNATNNKKLRPRYMEWYNKQEQGKVARPSKPKLASTKPPPRKEQDDSGSKEREIKPVVATKVSKRLLQDTEASASKKKIELPTAPGPEHPLIQHSKNRFEITLLPKRLEEDGDSGIALSRPAKAQKKSVFTIAYDDMQTKRLPESATTP